MNGLNLYWFTKMVQLATGGKGGGGAKGAGKKGKSGGDKAVAEVAAKVA